MTLSVWRYAHLALAVVSCLFLIMASITGVILAFDPVNEKLQPYKVDGFEQISLAESIPALKKEFTEITELSVDHNQFVTLDGFDEEGNNFKEFIHPLTGERLGEPKSKSEFINWVTALHRSLFLKETGRFLVGLISFLLMLIVVSGTILILKRQQGIRHFFSKIHKDSWAQYFHVVSGRLLLIPIFIIALTGTYLFMLRFDWIPNPELPEVELGEIVDNSEKQIPLEQFAIFQNIKLSEVQKVEFPFFEDPEEFYKIKLKDKELVIDQFNGQVLQEINYPKTKVWEEWSMNLHTGRTNIVWAIILGIASLNILFFIYSGFAITLKRKAVKIRNKWKANEAEIVLLVGSENGSTLHFAKKFHQQLLAKNLKSYWTEMDKYEVYPNAQKLILMTSTHGLGDAPSNAKQFEKLLSKHPQNQKIQYSVVGFGSKSYEDFAGFAVKVDNWLGNQSWAERELEVFKIHDKSVEEFIDWVKLWNEKTEFDVTTSASVYQTKLPKLKTFKVVSVGTPKVNGDVFQVDLETNEKFQSGDILAIYPGAEHKERFYSISKSGKKIKLVVKYHEFGLGSQFLKDLKLGEILKGRILENPNFHFPKQASKVVLIGNGTGIAPYLGMVEDNQEKVETHVYCGFRFNNATSKSYAEFFNQQIEKGHLKNFQFAFSREENFCYVMDFVRKDAKFFAELLNNKGSIMICGSLAMQNDVEAVLNEVSMHYLGKPIAEFKEKGLILTDCY
jgi:sulfite reductase (NADPH) flavoprotein alpha-component